MNKLLLIQIMLLASFHITSFRLCQWIITGWKRGIRRAWAALEKIADTVGKNVICIILQGKSYQGVNTAWSCCSLGQETLCPCSQPSGVYISMGYDNILLQTFLQPTTASSTEAEKGYSFCNPLKLLQAKETSSLALPAWNFASTLASFDWGLIYIL